MHVNPFSPNQIQVPPASKKEAIDRAKARSRTEREVFAVIYQQTSGYSAVKKTELTNIVRANKSTQIVTYVKSGREA